MQRQIKPFIIGSPNSYGPGDLFWINDPTYKGIYEAIVPITMSNQAELQSAIDGGEVVISQQFLINMFDKVFGQGGYLHQRGNKDRMHLARRIAGADYWAMDTNELFLYDGNNWVKPNDPVGYGIEHDGSLYGNGTIANPLQTLDVAPTYDGNQAYPVGKVVSGMIGGQQGIFRIDSVAQPIWSRTDIRYLNLNVQQTFQSGDYFYSDELSVRNIYRVNHLISIFGLQDLIGHINSGEVTGLINGAPTTPPIPAVQQIYQWSAGTVYFQGDLVYDTDNIGDLTKFWTLIVPTIQQQTFIPFMPHPTPVLLANIGSGGAGGGSVPVGSMISFLDAFSTPNGFLRCDGASVTKAQYPELFSVIGDYFGSTALTFNLPTATNTIIRTI